MARRTYRRRRRRSFRRYKQINQYEVLKCKFEYCDILAFPLNQAGPIGFESRQALIPPNFMATQTLLTAQSYYNTLTSLFAYYRVFGVSIEAVPAPTNINGGVAITNLSPIYIAYNPGSSAVMNLASIRSFNGTLMLDATMRKRKYTTLYGGTADYKATTDTTTGGITVLASENGTKNNSPAWTCKVIVYVIFKRSRI